MFALTDSISTISEALSSFRF